MMKVEKILPSSQPSQPSATKNYATHNVMPSTSSASVTPSVEETLTHETLPTIADVVKQWQEETISPHDLVLLCTSIGQYYCHTIFKESQEVLKIYQDPLQLAKLETETFWMGGLWDLYTYLLP